MLRLPETNVGTGVKFATLENEISCFCKRPTRSFLCKISLYVVVAAAESHFPERVEKTGMRKINTHETSLALESSRRDALPHENRLVVLSSASLERKLPWPSQLCQLGPPPSIHASQRSRTPAQRSGPGLPGPSTWNRSQRRRVPGGVLGSGHDGETAGEWRAGPEF